MTKRTVLVVEPFNGGSHQAWVEGWRNSSRHDVVVISHEGRAWRWRMRGSAVTLAALAEDWVSLNGRPDVVVATDMIDLASFLGLTRCTIATVPSVIYMHENQLTYPRQPGEALDWGLAWATWRSLVAADEIWCNSSFHRHDLEQALPAFLDSVPDHDHRHLLPEVLARMTVMPVGLDAARLSQLTRERTPSPLVLSNQRWHHDKDIGSVLRALIRIADEGVDFEVAILGEDRGGEADVLRPLVDRLGERVRHRGHLPRPEYESVLGRTDVVVSAARNEFFGIAVAEAIAAGAWPVVPASLSYPEVIPEGYHPSTLYHPGDLTRRLRTTIEATREDRSAIDGLAESMTRFDWSVIAADYDDRIDDLATSGSPAG